MFTAAIIINSGKHYAERPSDFLPRHRNARIPGCYTPIPMGAFYTVAKLPVDDAEKFCAWCLSDFRWKDEHTPSAISFSGRTIPCIGETVMMAPAQGFYTTPDMGRDQVRLAYVLCREDIRRSIFVLEKALEEYNR